MALYPMCRRSDSRLPFLALSLGMLHCDDSAVVIQRSEGAANAESDGATRTNGSTAGAPADSDGNPPSDVALGGAPSSPSSGKPSGPPGACQPRAVGDLFWTTERDAIQITFECGTGEPLSGEALQFFDLPNNANFDVASRTLTFTPGLDQAGVYVIGVGVVGTTDAGQFEVQVADAFDAPDNVPVNPATYTEEFGLPVVHLATDPGINGDDYLPAAITYRGHAFADAQAKYRGNTSLKYPQKSFTLKFAKEDRFGDPSGVAGFTGKRKVTLTTTFDDNSYLRARLAFELWNRIGSGSVQVKAYSAVLYLNGQFSGVYTITDHVDRHLMEDHDLFEDGNLYKARTHDANFRLIRSEEPLGPKLSLSEGYTKEEGTPPAGEPGANADLEELVNWVATSSSEDFLAELDSRLARKEYEDWWLLVSLINAGDSAGKNSYHYHDARVGAPDGAFHVVPWDFNDSFGQAFVTFRGGREATRDPEELQEYNLLFERMLAEPSTREPLLDRLRAALDNEWELGSVLQSVDAWAAEIDAAAARNERLWGAMYDETFAPFRDSDVTTHLQEVAFVRQWIIDRWTFVADYYR